MPETWKQEGPLGDAEWAVELTDRIHNGAPTVIVSGDQVSFVLARNAEHLRDFARALDRAAAALETAVTGA